MGRRIFIAAVIICFCSASRLLGHDESPFDYRHVLAESNAVAIAEVLGMTEEKEECEVRKIYTLRPLSLLKGTADLSREYQLRITHYFWKEARFPWQKSCPSVSYCIPPAADDMHAGVRVIATLRNDPLWGWIVTSTKDMKELDEVKAMLRR